MKVYSLIIIIICYVCKYTSVDIMPKLKNFCLKIVPFVYFYKKQIDSYNKTVHDILIKEIPLILLKFQKKEKEKRDIITSIVTGFIGLAYKSISSCIHNEREMAFKESCHSYEKPNEFRNKQNFHLEDSMVIYGIYNSETIEN